MANQLQPINSLEEAVYMLSGDTTVYPSMLLENTNVKSYLKSYVYGKITYEELLKLTYKEF